MLLYWDFLKKRWKWATTGPWAMVEKLSAVIGLVLAGIVWFRPAWARSHISEEMNAFLLGVIPLACGFSVFAVRWMLSPFWVYKAELNEAALREESLRNQLKAMEACRLDRRERLLLECADLLKQNKSFLEALQITKADELESNDDLNYVCERLEAAGHTNPFKEGGGLSMVVPSFRLGILRELRLRGIGADESAIFDWCMFQRKS